jgi:Zn-dependent protease with chaperone function/uncharacterized tellurite resistance protein B-like protein
MDFFEAQARAKKRTSRLVILFALAVAGTIFAGYMAAMIAMKSGVLDSKSTRRNHARYESSLASSSTGWWDPRTFAFVTISTLGVVGCASLFKWAQFRTGGSAVAESVNGRRVDAHTTDLSERRLLNVVEEMAIASGVSVPAVYILDDETAINAFAAGLTTSDAVVAVTRGTLEKLNRDELQAVIGHEFSHILNGDMRLNVKLTAVVFGILVIGLIGRGIISSMRYTRSRDSKNSGGILIAIFVSGLVMMIIGYVGYFFGRLIQAAVSRQREFLADASSVQFTRNPSAMTGSLKKIGGYALGSSLQNTKSTAIGHFFFAQGFKSQFGGAWATHPPLEERIRAIDPQFDGKFFEPPTTVDVAHESFQTAGFAPRLPAEQAVAAAFSAPASVPPRLPPARIPFKPAAAVVDAGQPTAAHFATARQLLANLPERIRQAARTPAEAAVLLYGLVLDRDATRRAQQQALVTQHAGEAAAQLLTELRPSLSLLAEEARLPVLQLAFPALRQLDPAALDRFLTTLDELVHADGNVSIFEFTLQKMLIRQLQLGQKPSDPATQIFSFNAVVPEIAVVLSALARASNPSETAANQFFVAGTTQLKLIETKLALLDPAACDVAHLDPALDKLSRASGPIKQRLLTAAGYVVEADGQVSVAEAELLRAVAAVLDVPLPPFLAPEDGAATARWQ